jgi:two-component system, NarL family, nitrate/nitrite response regulator NarL
MRNDSIDNSVTKSSYFEFKKSESFINRSTSDSVETMSKAKIVLVDDHPHFRRGVRKLLERTGYLISGEASDGRSALIKLKKLTPDLLLNGPELIRNSRIEELQFKVIVISQSDDDHRIAELAQLGIDGHLLKSEGSEEILRAVETVLSGGRYFSNRVGQRLFDLLSEHRKMDSPKREVFHLVSERQLQVAQLLSEGKTTREIAQSMACSENTVKSHKANLMRKIKARNSREVALWYLTQIK